MAGVHVGNGRLDASQCFRTELAQKVAPVLVLRLMDKLLHDLKDSTLWELWYIPYNE